MYISKTDADRSFRLMDVVIPDGYEYERRWVGRISGEMQAGIQDQSFPHALTLATGIIYEIKCMMCRYLPRYIVVLRTYFTR